MLARDAFNGLQLWQQTLRPSPARGGFNFQIAPGSVCPVAMGELLLVVTDKQLWALDGATGQPVRAYPAADTPTDVFYLEETLITIDDASVRALQPDNGQLRWKVDVAEPRYVSAGDGAVYLIGGSPRRGEKCVAMRLDLATGKVVWQKDDFAWLPEVRRSVYHRGLLAYEISTYSDDKEGNRIEVVSADDARPLWNHTFVPGTAHKKQARAMFVGDLLWVLGDRQCAALDPQTGEVKKTYPAGWGHCFPPVATGQYLFAGEMDMTNLISGQVDANRITKGNCGRDAGFIPANGLIYVCPKHCICWPMLRDYAALAPARAEDLGQSQRPTLEVGQFAVEKGEATEPDPLTQVGQGGQDAPVDDWPCYRHDAWRSGSTGVLRGTPSQWKVLWRAALGDRPQGPIADDWRYNPFVPGPVTPPVIAGATVFVARGDAHQIVAINADTGATRWTFTANGRIDTAPTIHRGMCLFGTKAGWVYCLRADDGRMVWRLRAAPLEEQIVAYGQIESPWPVPGSVLVVDDVAYFAAGRQSLADGGILVFAVDPPTGKVQWVRRIDSVPQKHFYGGLGLEFDNFDLLQREGDGVAMSRWLLQRGDGQTTVESESGFARLKTGSGEGVMFPRGCWSYAPREETERVKTRPYLRPLAVFRDSTLLSCSEDRRTVFRRDFDLANEQFNTVWSVRNSVRESGDTSRSQRLARGAKWSVEVLPSAAGGTGIAAMVLAGNTLLVADSQGSLMAMDAEDGTILARHELPSPVWDGMAAAAGRVFLTTSDGQVVCVGE